SRRCIPARRACVRKSGVVSITTLCPAYVTRIEGRRRLSRASAEVQTSHWQPMVGTPTLVPEPRTVIFSGKSGIRLLLSRRLRSLTGLVGDLDEAEAELSQRVFQQTLLFERKIAFGFFEQHPH